MNGSSHWVVFTFQLVVSYFPWCSPEDNWGCNGLQMLVTPLSYGPLGAHSGLVTQLHQALRFRGSNRWPLTCPSTPPVYSIHHTPVGWHITWIIITPICCSQPNHPNTMLLATSKYHMESFFQCFFNKPIHTQYVFLMKGRLGICSSFRPKE